MVLTFAYVADGPSGSGRAITNLSVKSDEFPQRVRRWCRRERMKFKNAAGVETCVSGRSLIYKRQQRSDRLVDTVPLLCSLIYVIVRRIDRLGYTLKPMTASSGPPF